MNPFTKLACVVSVTLSAALAVPATAEAGTSVVIRYGDHGYHDRYDRRDRYHDRRDYNRRHWDGRRWDGDHWDRDDRRAYKRWKKEQRRYYSRYRERCWSEWRYSRYYGERVRVRVCR